jgi:hypothetical protein
MSREEAARVVADAAARVLVAAPAERLISLGAISCDGNDDLNRAGKMASEVKMDFDGRDLFVFLNGRKIAKRGRIGTQYAGKWMLLEPGFEIVDIPPVKIEVRRDGTLIGRG